METYHEDKTIQDKEKEEQKAYDEALKQFRLSPAYPIIMKLIEEKISEVTDTRQLARTFGKIKNDVIGELGTLGIASLMASQPLEDLKSEIE
jgi:hypothetical protein